MTIAHLIASSVLSAMVQQSIAASSNSNRDHDLYIDSSGDRRYALLHLPPAAESQKAIPLVVMLHPMAETAAEMVTLTGFNDVADKEGLAVIYPQGKVRSDLLIGYTFNAGQCCPNACGKKADDVQFMKDIVAYMKKNMASVSGDQFTLDPKRVYLSGASNGGFMANRIGCQAPNLFAALAPVSGPIANGSSWIYASDPYECPDLSNPLPAIYFHGTHDTLVPFYGGGLEGFPSIPSYVTRMKKRNGIADDSGVVTYRNGDVLCTAYGTVAQNFTFCKHSSGHCWPGRTTQGACTTSIDASAEIWEFFKNHQLGDDVSALIV